MVFGFLKKKKKENSSQFKSLVVKEVIKETSDAVSIVFDDSQNKLTYTPGQFLTLIRTINGDEVRRAYSISSCASLGENITVTIKRVEGGLMSNDIIDNIKAGDSIDILEPMGHFSIDIDSKQEKQVFLFGGGSGITPLMSITKTILNDEPKSKVNLIYANSNLESIIFQSTLEKLQEQFPDRFNIVHFLEIAPENWSGHTGYLTAEALKNIITEQKDSNFSNQEFMTCGPAPMMNIVMETLDQLDIADKNKHKESFVASAPEENISSDTIKDQKVKIVLEGEEHEFNVPREKSILESGLDDGLDIPFSCQSGLCTACRAKCVEGEVEMNGVDTLSKDEKEEGYVLLCVSHPKTSNVKVIVG
ncbi:MAG: ferredoxin--NADP reductase [Reichenbachiella sp.]